MLEGSIFNSSTVLLTLVLKNIKSGEPWHRLHGCHFMEPLILFVLSVKVLTNVRNYYFSYHGCLRQGTFYSIKLSN